MNRLQKILNQNKKLLSIYFTAGYPNIDDTTKIILELEKNGIDFIEIGLPFSDPLADGPTIQASSTAAIHNGMTTKLLFEQLQDIRSKTQIPLLIMGYFNPILQYGVEEFCQKCAHIGIDALIIPDLPLEIYTKDYQPIFEKYNIANIFLITPQTSNQRIHQIDNQSNTFIYVVSTAAITGSEQHFGNTQTDYFQRITNMNLKNPQIIGFGINNKATFEQATLYAKGAIIGSAFIKNLSENGINSITPFINTIR